MPDELLTSYEEMPYESHAVTVSHPSRMAALGVLHGLNPPAVERCRVLELGCAGGGNIIPLADTLPDAEFVGIDLSPRQIADGQQIVDELGLKNIRLSATSILDVDRSFGEFDYIICHGVYSWVPARVREKILEICRWTLAPEGLAYISYNTYPGWHVRGSLRSAMRYHARRFTSPKRRVEQARAMLTLIGKAVADKNAVISYMVQEEVERLGTVSDSYIYHEHLEAENNPFYFHEFLAQLEPYGMQWVAEAKPSDPSRQFSAEVLERIDEVASDPLQREQYLDFLRDRLFRRSVICHKDRQVQRPPMASEIRRLWLGAAVRPASPTPDCKTEAPEKFVAPDEATVTIGHPTLKTALVVLFEARPRTLHYDVLRAAVAERLGSDTDTIDEHLPAAMLQCYLSRFAELFSTPPPMASEPGERPMASRLGLLQARQSERVTNLWHRATELDGFNHQLFAMLDGTKTRPELVDVLLDSALEGKFALKHEGVPVTDPAQLRQVLEGCVELSLRALAHNGLLVR